MTGRLYADVEVPSAARPWRDRLEAIAYQLYRGHVTVPGLDPHLFLLATPPLPAVLAVGTATYRALLDGGLGDRDAGLAGRALLGYAADRGASTAKRLALRRANPQLPGAHQTFGDKSPFRGRGVPMKLPHHTRFHAHRNACKGFGYGQLDHRGLFAVAAPDHTPLGFFQLELEGWKLLPGGCGVWEIVLEGIVTAFGTDRGRRKKHGNASCRAQRCT
jgi:hypothetical protein